MNVHAETSLNIFPTPLSVPMAVNNKQDSKYVLVVGLGVTGLSVVRYLSAREYSLMIVDSRLSPPCLAQLKNEFPEVTLHLGPFESSDFIHAEQIVLSPGVALQEPVLQSALEKGIEIIGDIELFAQQNTLPVIAVTGSNGKSTVVSLLGAMAKAAGIQAVVGGNIGVPVLDAMSDVVDLYILELSSFQLESLQSLKPVAATVLNVSPDHLDRYEDYTAYIQTKQRIYSGSTVIVVNRDDNQIDVLENDNNNQAGFTLGDPGTHDFGLREIKGKTWLCQGADILIAASDLKISGSYNLANALAALALGNAANIPMKAMLEVLKSFSGLAHRTQWITEKHQVTWINDSKGTNVGATLAAINGIQLNNKLILIAGGVAKNADFSQLNAALCNKARGVVLIGQDAPKIEQALQQCVPIESAKTMMDAVAAAAKMSQPGDTVLLSPACASFDMFKGYEHRGDEFVKAIGKL